MNSSGRHIRDTPSRCSADARVEASEETGTLKSEVGFTLQTLIVTAVCVLAAVGVSLGLLAITSASSDDFEEAGKTGVEARCAPNEIWDQELEARGVRGMNDTYSEIVADAIGCVPVCGTWEYFSAGKNKNDEYELADASTARQSSIGGPDGNGGVYSTNIGCFAPCYWNFNNSGAWRPHQGNVKTSESSLQYFDDDRAPVMRQFRLGVNYRRSADLTASLDTRPGRLRRQNDLNLEYMPTPNPNKDGKPYINAGPSPPNGPLAVVGTLPLAPEMLEAGFPTVFKPNWITRGPDLGPGNRENTQWEDEDWEVRADPINKECTIVNIALDDKLICSSEWDNCAPRR